MKKVILFTIVIISTLFLISTGCEKKRELGEAKNIDLYICPECGDTIKADTTDANTQYVIGKGLEYRVTQHLQLCEKCKEKKAKQEAAEERKLGKIVGKWNINMPKGVYTIRNKNGAIKLYTVYSDGSSDIKDLIEKTKNGQKRLYVKGNDFGEYFIVEKDGKLGMYDNDGLISKLNKAK